MDLMSRSESRLVVGRMNGAFLLQGGRYDPKRWFDDSAKRGEVEVRRKLYTTMVAVERRII